MGGQVSEQEIYAVFEESLQVQRAVLETQLPVLARIAEQFIATFQAGGKALFFGNGGSAADAQHVVAELVNRLNYDRPALPAIALTTDTSVLTSIANDADFDQVFARQVQALAGPKDLVVGISTSGNSANVLHGLRAARALGAVTIAFTGRSGGQLKTLADFCFCAPSERTTRIQEAHITAWHAVCRVVEHRLFPA
ncbi:MAG: D-sedoheptulose 7-phosphate isomerase [Anaerolineae bacterium]|nr:D-sedoheptulose 7-phosphate isomerase [Anaerolineae bacterium]